jgi:hypothetical protein
MAVMRKKGMKENVEYRSPRIYLPTKLTDDSSFPFLEGEEVRVRIDGARLVVEKMRRSRLVRMRSGKKGKGSPSRRRRSKRTRAKRKLKGEGLNRVDDRTAE